MSSKRHGKNGFTLVEALASLVILGLLSVMIMSGIGTGRRVWEHAQSLADANESVEGTQAALRSVLERTFALVLNDSSSPSVVFTGAIDKVEFLGPAQDAHRPSELQKYRISLSPSGDLLLSSISDLALDPQAPPHDVVLIRNVQSIEFDYFGPAAPDNIPQWRQSWASQPRLPTLIRLRLGFMSGDRRWWPEFIVHPAATTDLHCGQSTTGQCGALL